jgi:hypothetical protein
MESLITFFSNHGWRRIITEQKLSYQTIDNDECYRDEELYMYYSKQWFHETNRTKSFKERLYLCGMTEHHSNEMYEIIKDLLESSYSYLQLFEIILEYNLGKYKPIIESNFISNIQLPVENSDENYIICYHSTNWSSYMNIKNNGINRLEGRCYLDFGSSSSFYITPDYNLCEYYLKAKAKLYSNQICILVFKIPLQGLKKFKTTIFSKPNKKWSELVKLSRMYNDDQGGNILDTREIVYGPIVANPNEIYQYNHDPRAYHDLKFQYAFKSPRSLAFLYKCWIGTHFYNI